MHANLKITGISGILAGVCLVGELTFFMASGWSPEGFADPQTALQILHEGGDSLRIAALFGFAGLALTIMLVLGLAARLFEAAPTAGLALLGFGVIGVAGHSLVPLSLWIGIPAYLDIAQASTSSARDAWNAFRVVLDGAQGVGNLFMGLSMLVAGWAIARSALATRPLGLLAALAGLLTIGTVLTIGTPMAGLGSMFFMPALAATILFRIWAGVELIRVGT